MSSSPNHEKHTICQIENRLKYQEYILISNFSATEVLLRCCRRLPEASSKSIDSLSHCIDQIRLHSSQKLAILQALRGGRALRLSCFVNSV